MRKKNLNHGHEVDHVLELQQEVMANIAGRGGSDECDWKEGMERGMEVPHVETNASNTKHQQKTVSTSR